MPKRPTKRKKKQKQHSTFPILKPKTIVCTLRELGISVLESDLRCPREEQCKAIYAQILRELMGVNMTKQVPFHKLGLFAFPSLHESSIVAVRLFRELIKFMRKVGVTDFSISDLISPDEPRTVRNLSAIINFARWRAQKHAIYVEEKVKIEALQSSLSAITEQNNRLAKHFVELKTKQQSEEPQVEALRAEIEELQSAATHEMQFHDQQSEEIHAIKKEIKRLRADAHEKKMLLQQRIKIVHSLDTKIVRSPQRIKRELRAVADQNARDKFEIEKLRANLCYDRNKLAQLEALHSAILKRGEEMERMAVLKNERHCEKEKELKATQTQKLAMEKELKSLHRARKSLAAALTAKKHEFSALQQAVNAEKREIARKNKEMNGLQEQHSKARIQKQMRIARLEKHIAAKREATRQREQQYRAFMQQTAQKMRMLADNVNNYHQQIRHAVDGSGDAHHPGWNVKLQ